MNKIKIILKNIGKYLDELNKNNFKKYKKYLDK